MARHTVPAGVDAAAAGGVSSPATSDDEGDTVDAFDPCTSHAGHSHGNGKKRRTDHDDNHNPFRSGTVAAMYFRKSMEWIDEFLSKVNKGRLPAPELDRRAARVHMTNAISAVLNHPSVTADRNGTVCDRMEKVLKEEGMKVAVGAYLLMTVYGNTREHLLATATNPGNNVGKAQGMNPICSILKLSGGRRTLRRHLYWALGFMSSGSSSKEAWNYRVCDFDKAKKKGLYFNNVAADDVVEEDHTSDAAAAAVAAAAAAAAA